MKLSKNKQAIKDPSEFVTIRTGSVNDFFANIRSVMCAADKGEPLEQRSATLTFVNPSEMLQFLSAAKIKLLDCIRSHPGSITNIAKTIGRNRAAVYRDIHEMETFGLVKMHEEINPGHGRHKIVELMASSLKLEAYI